ncbi:MAG: tRNA (5-methylaminomethyl-2-thiouridylate)-methyltransferase, partial [Planctomycetia bacterium]|nr:tRNA (5-methylaminomethyl-2-thiouridylate)-methyltransferase [Planctomycetia bacterium]
VKVLNVTRKMLKIVKNPEHGYGSQMNPCLDCRINMFREAGRAMHRMGAAFIFTGEVLGQRPMSQRRDAMKLIDAEAGVAGYVLRPLSAKLLPPTEPEKSGIVDREKLLAIAGRSRKPQMALAEQLDLKDYPCPAGGCLLTDPGFAHRLRELLEHDPDARLNDVQLLTAGRHFRLGSAVKLVVGRDEKDNAKVRALARPGDVLIEASDIVGPTALLRGEADEADIQRACELVLLYAKAPAGERHNCTVTVFPDGPERTVDREPAEAGAAAAVIGVHI